MNGKYFLMIILLVFGSRSIIAEEFRSEETIVYGAEPVTRETKSQTRRAVEGGKEVAQKAAESIKTGLSKAGSWIMEQWKSLTGDKAKAKAPMRKESMTVESMKTEAAE